MGCGGNHKLFLRGRGINENAFDGVLGEVVYVPTCSIRR